MWARGNDADDKVQKAKYARTGIGKHGTSNFMVIELQLNNKITMM